MTKRFRMVAGPNGSGKSTLVGLLRGDYAVNFYTMLNADAIFAEVSGSLAYQPVLPVSGEALKAFAAASAYEDETRNAFLRDGIVVKGDTIVFTSRRVVNSYTIALLTNFLQSECIAHGVSFSQETVFSHPSKIQALRIAQQAGFRTYLYFVANQDVSINVSRIANRVQSGGHDVPTEKVLLRAQRCLSQVKASLPFCSRAYFFDNSAVLMRFLAEYSLDGGFSFLSDDLPVWFRRYVLEGHAAAQG